MTKTKRIISFCIAFALIYPYIVISTTLTASALQDERLDKWSANDIMFYDPDECDEEENGGGGVTINAEDLPSEAISLLEAADVKNKAETNYDAYKAGADDAGIPWQVIAALHYREAGMNPNSSISNGESLGAGKSSDGVTKGNTLAESAKVSANHFVYMAKISYDLDVKTMESTLDNWGEAFLAYNRGVSYKNAGAAWDTSPYPANYMDSSHLGMSFPTNVPGETVAGGKDANVGALVVFIYLGGMSGSSGGGSSGTSSSDGENVTWIGDSLSVNADNYKLFDEKLSKADKYIKVSKQFGEAPESNAGGKGGLTILKELKKDNKVRKILVYALGTNSSGLTQKDIDNVLSEADKAEKIVFVNNYEKGKDSTYASNNKLFAKAEKDNNKVIVADWKSIAEKNPDDYYDGNEKIHPNKAGMEKWMNEITSKLNLNSSNTTEKEDRCECDTTAKKQGGSAKNLTNDQAEKIVAYFKDSKNDSKWTPSLKKWNCVSMSTFFVQMFTSVGGAPAANGGAKKSCLGCDDGGDVVNKLEALGVDTGTEPKPYAIFSVTGPYKDNTGDYTQEGKYSTLASGKEGHTGVITAVDGDTITFIEAAWGNNGYAGVKTTTKSNMINARHDNVYAYLDSKVDSDALAKALGEKVNTASSNGSEGVAKSDVKWKDGWITSGLDGYEKDDNIKSNDSSHNGSFSTKRPKDKATGPNKILLHNTEGAIGANQKGSDVFNALYKDSSHPKNHGSYPPHFTIDMKTKRVFQHYPITKPSDAVASHDAVAGVQIEIAGYSTEADKDSGWYLLSDDDFGDAEWSYLAKLLSAISSETGIPLTSSVDWANPKKLTADELKTYEGIVGHMHLPDNDHSDPNNIWPKLSNALGGESVSTDKCTKKGKKKHTGAFPWYDQFDPDWKDKSYGSCGTIGSSGCGPTSFAMMATALTGTEYLPDEVAKYAGDKGMHVCGSGSSHSLPETIGDHFGVTSTNISGQGADKISEYLKNGYMVWTCAKGASPYTTGGHCIGFRGITDDGKWLVADSNSTKGEDNTKNKEFEPSALYQSGAPYKALKAK